jgi:hypothetical protein
MSETPPKNNQEITVRNDSNITSSSLKIPEFIKSNPFLTLLNVGLIIGGILAYWFFAKIKYLPELDLENATTLLIGVAVVGMVVFIGIVFCLILPSLFIQTTLNLLSPPIEDTYLDEDYLKKVKKQHADALLISSTLTAVVATIGWVLFFSWKTYSDRYYLLAILALLIALTLLQMYRYQKALVRFGWNRVEKIFGNKTKFTKLNCGFLLAWSIPSFILIVILAKPFDDQYKNESWFGIGLLIASFLVLVINNSMLAISHHNNKPTGKLFFQRYLITIFSCLVIYANLPSNQPSLINVPFQILHLGNVSNSIFVVNAEACKMLNTLKPKACLETNNLGCVVPKRVASRIGTEYLLIFDSRARNSELIEITIPLKKDYVLGWSFNDQSTSASCKK